LNGVCWIGCLLEYILEENLSAGLMFDTGSTFSLSALALRWKWFIERFVGLFQSK